MSNIEMDFLSTMNNIIYNGYIKTPERVDFNTNVISKCSRTKMLPNKVLHHNMADGFPLFTHRKMPFKSACVELEGFIQGKTSKKWYQDRGCNYWDHWSNPHSSNEDDLGAIYPHSWRSFGESLDPQDNGVPVGVDQLYTLINEFKKAPHSRRGVVVNWNPLQLSRAGLVPCHIAFTVSSSGSAGEYLNLMFTQRSCDLPRGHNIHSYALLLSLICKHLGRQPGILTACYADAHIYERDWEICEKMSNLPISKLPSISLPQDLDIFKWTHKDVELVNYNSGPKIKFPEVEV